MATASVASSALPLSSGHALTAQGTAILDCARGIEDAARELERRAPRVARVTSDCIRVSAAPVVMDHWVARLVAAFREIEPDVTVDMDASETSVSLEAGEADIAIQRCFAPPELLHPLWLVAGPEAYRQPQVRAFMGLAGRCIPRGRWLWP